MDVSDSYDFKYRVFLECIMPVYDPILCSYISEMVCCYTIVYFHVSCILQKQVMYFF